MKTKALISFAITAKLICVFVFAYAKCWFSHDAAQMILPSMISDEGTLYWLERLSMINLLVTNGLAHPHHLDEAIFIFRNIRSNDSFLFYSFSDFVSADRTAPYGTPACCGVTSSAILFAYVT